MSAGFLSLLLGIIGAVLPVLPTTPFIILASWCFDRSSPKLHNWLRGLPTFGPAIIDWEQNQIIRPRAKWGATVVIVLTFGLSIGLTQLHLALKLLLLVIAALVLLFIWTRNSGP